LIRTSVLVGHFASYETEGSAMTSHHPPAVDPKKTVPIDERPLPHKPKKTKLRKVEKRQPRKR
jgi:hypothetical protein